MEVMYFIKVDNTIYRKHITIIYYNNCEKVRKYIYGEELDFTFIYAIK